jgi:hypothetical protein
LSFSGLEEYGVGLQRIWPVPAVLIFSLHSVWSRWREGSKRRGVLRRLRT